MNHPMAVRAERFQLFRLDALWTFEGGQGLIEIVVHFDEIYAKISVVVLKVESARKTV